MQEVLDDFTLAKTAIMDNMAIKLQCYQAPPWNFASMSHRDAEVAQAAARRIVQAFDNSPQDPALHHRKTWMHLSHGSATRTELDLFCSGVLQMRDLPHLRQVAWSARFLPVIERLQEADHSLVARGCRNAPRAGGPYVSCRLRMEESRAYSPSQGPRLNTRVTLTLSLMFRRRTHWQSASDSGDIRCGCRRCSRRWATDINSRLRRTSCTAWTQWRSSTLCRQCRRSARKTRKQSQEGAMVAAEVSSP